MNLGQLVLLELRVIEVVVTTDVQNCSIKPNRKYLFNSVMGLGHNKNVLYPKPFTLAKGYLWFYRCRGPYVFDKTSKVFIFNNTI